MLEKHRINPEDEEMRGHFDYPVGAFEQLFNDSVAEGRLPRDIARSYLGSICERVNLPPALIPAALLTPDGEWHDLGDFGWRMLKEPSDENRAALKKWKHRYKEQIAAHQDCWVVAMWVHS